MWFGSSLYISAESLPSVRGQIFVCVATACVTNVMYACMFLVQDSYAGCSNLLN